MQDSLKKTYTDRLSSVWRSNVWNPLKPYNLEVHIEKRRKVAKFLYGEFDRIEDLKVLDMGCGRGENIQMMIDFGVTPQCISGVDLMDEFVEIAKSRLAKGVELFCADVRGFGDDCRYDVVLQFVLLTSILTDKDRNDIASNTWRLLKPGGFVVCYDFCFNNPKNKMVRKLTVNDVMGLYPEGDVSSSRVTVAPPIGRSIVNKLPLAYPFLSAIKLLCTHNLCIIKKPKY